MSVRVYTDEREGSRRVNYSEATTYEVDGRDTLHVYGPPTRTGVRYVLASFAGGRWNRAELVPDADPEPPLLTSGSVVRIPGIVVPYVVDRGLATSGAHATLTFTTVDGRDWDVPRMGTSPEPAVNAAAEPIPDATKCPSVTLAPKSVNPGEDAEYRAALDELRATTAPAEAVLSETSEPFVSVNLSVTSDNSGEVVKVIRKLVREGRLSAGSLA